ncbi:MAG: hypothetical protein VX741_10160, partial [Pseudomonadota bacterium]|nr:hypothetical protein [Pseudomonadota bacterium]
PLPSLGSQFTGSMKIGHQQVPMPPRQWTVQGSSEAYTAIGNSGATLPVTNVITLAKQNGDNPFLILIGNIPDGQFGWQASPRCSRENRLHNETIINQDGGSQDCWWVRTASPGRGLLRHSANKQSHSHENAKQVLE